MSVVELGYWPEGGRVVEPALGHWIAGFIDGEGCFRVHSERRGSYYAAHFALKQRDDDASLLAFIADRTGIGRVKDDGSRSGNSKPCAVWVVESKIDAQRLVCLIDKFPLRSRKARDYEVWRRAVMVWTHMERGSRWKGPRDWTPMIELKAELEDGRVYAGRG